MIKKLASHLGEYKRAAILTPIFAALEAVMDILLPTIMAFIIDLGIEKGDMNAIVKYGLLTFAVAAIALLLGVLAGKYAAEASTGFAGNLRDAMYENIQHYSFSNIDKFSTAGLVTRMTTDVTNLQNAFQMMERMCVRAPVHLVFALIMAFSIGGPLALIFVVAIAFLLASNMSEVLGVFTAALLGFTLLNPVHLLFINLITDCFPALALGLERPEPDIMDRPPRSAKDGVFSGGLGFDIAYQGVLITVITLISYLIGHCMEVGYFEMPRGVSPDGMTMAFLTMSMCEIFHSFNMRSQRRSVFTLRGHNRVLWAAMLGSLVLTTVVLEVPPIAAAFGFTPVGWAEYGIALALAVLVIPVVELVKFIQRRRAR